VLGATVAVELARGGGTPQPPGSCTAGSRNAGAAGAGSLAAATPPPGWPTSVATKAENDQSGNGGWAANQGGDVNRLAAWADHDSVAPGGAVRLFVRAANAPVTVTAYRMGWYGGKRARRVWTSPAVTDTVQPAPTFEPPTRTVSAANWHPSLTVPTAGWAPGDYLFRLQDSVGRPWYVPLAVRASSTRGAVVLVNGGTTWQA